MVAAIKKKLDFRLAPIEEIIGEARNGRMFILVDDENRENEGDLVIPAQMATAEAVNFMAKHGRGLICLAMDKAHIDRLGLSMMTLNNKSRHTTAFTVSIEAREGITTGISAADRAHTIQTAINPECGPDDIVSPGHVFPLMARDGGVLVRAGHTEAAVDIARLAGMIPAGVICEIMKDDGTMARLPDLVAFASKHNMKVASIADLITFRRRNEKLVERMVETSFHSQYGGDFNLIIYRTKVGYAEHVALVKGDLTKKGPVLVRMHALDVLNDVLGGGDNILGAAMQEIASEGRGVVVLIREPRPTSLSDRVCKSESKNNQADVLRDYGVGAQILADLGVTDMILLSNTKRSIIGLDGYGLTISGQRAIPLPDCQLQK